MTTHARNALTLVAERYCLHQTDILEIAPFLFYWAAESSLRERRKSVERLSHSIDEDARASELDSIDRCDLFGEALKDNPFELFLRDLAESVGENVSMDSFDFCDYPDYRICGEEAALIADGDADLAEQILEGSAPLHEVPKELNEPGMFRERGRWLRERLNDYRSEQMRRFTKLDQGEKTSA
jgi:hypothetical protein